MKLDRIVVVGEGPADLQVIPVLVKRWVRQSGGQIDQVHTYPMKSIRVNTFQKKVLAILNLEPTGPVLIVVDRDADRERLARLQEGRSKAGDPPRCVIGLAVEMLEAWLLADPEAWRKVFPNIKNSHYPRNPN